MSIALSRNVLRDTLPGVFLTSILAFGALQLSQVEHIQNLAISPLVIGILMGLIYASTARSSAPESWRTGIQFSGKRLLRLGIILYGFRLTFQQIADVGLFGFLVSVTIVATTMLVGSIIGMRFLKLDRDTSLLISAGSAVCGAAAVLAAETTLKSENYKSAIAVATVVMFGTLSMFFYPILQAMGLLNLDPKTYGIFIGSSVHEVAQVVAAGSAVMGATQTAVVVKMTRVMLLTPFLLIMGLAVNRQQKDKPKLHTLIPWFAVGFVAIIGFNSLNLISGSQVEIINTFDTFILTMAMTALGMETHLSKFKEAGIKPLILASALFIWLAFMGLALVKI